MSLTMTMTEHQEESVAAVIQGRHWTVCPQCEQVLPGEEQVGREGIRALLGGGPVTAHVWRWETAVYEGRAGGNQPGTSYPPAYTELRESSE